MILGIPGPKGLLIDMAVIGGGVVLLVFALGFIAGYRVAQR